MSAPGLRRRFAHILPELAALPLLPLLIAQGRRARRVAPRLPEAGGPCGGQVGEGRAGAPLSLLALGESPVAGVGVTSHEEAITGQLAQALTARLRRPVRWRACGRNGITAADALEQLLPQIPPEPVDVALVAFGVNDSTAFRSVGRWHADLSAVLQALDARCRPRLVLLSGVPPLAHFPALPQPLRWVMGLKANALDAAARQLADARIRHVPLTLDLRQRELMASDGYHPSAAGCAAWAGVLADVCVAALTAADESGSGR
jgi:lysophospholipase L1-like esterase